MSEVVATKKYYFLEGGGEMGQRTRAFDWSSTPVGAVENWPQALKTTVGILLHSSFPMFLWWGEDMIQFYNDAYRPSLGEDGKHPKALGQKAIECWPEIWDIISPLINQVKTTNTSFFLEDQLVPIFRNGKIEDVYWTFSYSSVIGESGGIDGVLVVCTETTGKVNMLREIERSKENLTNIILKSPVAMCILKGDEHIVETANERMFQLWGKSPAEVLGRPIFDELHEAAREGFKDLCDNVFRTGESFSAYGAPVTLPRDGTTVTAYVHFVYEPFRDGNGTITGVMVVAVDVSEEIAARRKLEESENSIRALVESAPLPIAVYVGREMRIALANQSIIDVWGKGNDVIGKTYYALLPELEIQQIYPNLDNVFTTGIPFHARHQRVDLVMSGELQTFYFNYSFTPLFDSQGKVYGVMNTAAEVTDLVEAKLQVERSERNFRNMVKQAPVAMCIMLGPSHVVEVANDLFISLWGKTAKEMMNRPIFEGLPDAKGQGLEELLANVYATGQTFTALERPVVLLRHGQHETVYQNFVYEPYRDADGTILGVLAITVDVTAQVVARQQIEEVVMERTRELKQSNAELSQFAYITSHDLQEPARKIRTFSGMLLGSLGNSIDERSKKYLSKIDVAASRMLSLIRDVLALSQLSSKTAEFEPIDLNKILEEIKSDFELLIEQKGSIIISDTLPVIDAIGIQMNQLFTNLISNALKFSRPDVPHRLIIRCDIIEKELRGEFPLLNPKDRYVKLQFIDNGIGFNKENARQIFDIFQRLHTREEYQGTGIGLAMCKKIAENHGGLISADATMGQGATFTVILPVSQG
jgi:PAS domain S-box-containing protein